MKNFHFIVFAACAAALSLASCQEKNNPSKPTEDYVITQFAGEPFLGETYITDYDYEAGNRFLLERYKEEKTGACSSFRNGNFAARNLDWYVRDYAVLVVHTAAAKGRYASVGIVSSNPFINRAMIASGKVQDKVSKGTVTVDNWRNIFPIFTTDGINEKGLCANVNIVMHEEGVREGYKKCTGGDDIPYMEKTSFVSLVRLILDKCATCQEAINMCDTLHVTQAFSGALAYEDNHIMVSDAEETVILEWYNDKMEYTRFPASDNFRSEQGMPAIMTNFYNYIGRQHLNDDGSIKLEEMLAEHPYAMGVERYEIIRSGWEQATTAEAAKALISNVYYSKYFDFNAKWYTENGMFCVKVGNDWYYPSCCPFTENDYVKAESLLDAIHKMYEPTDSYMVGTIEAFGSLDEQMRNLDAGIEAEDNWYTELTSIYDISKKTLQIMPQEGWYNKKYYPFTVFGNRQK